MGDADAPALRLTPGPGTGVPTDLLLFDCDGVLVDSEPISGRVFAEVLTECGLPTTPDESNSLYRGRTMKACVALAEARLGRPLPADLIPRYDARVRAEFERSLQPVPGVARAIETIVARGLATCVASSGSVAKMQLTLGLTGLLPHFEGRLYSATDVPRSKPHPDVFLHAAREMGAEPARCCVVEDSPLGVEAGVAAGMRVLGFARETGAGILSEAGAQVFHEMDALPALIRSTD